MSNSITPLDELFNAFAYPLLKPALAQSLADQYCVGDINTRSLNQNVMYLGALLAVGRIDEYQSLVEHTDFNQLSYNDRVTFVDSLFRAFQNQLCASGNNEIFVEALLSITRALLPSVMYPTRKAVNFSGEENTKLIRLPYASRIVPHVKGMVFFRQLFMGPGSRKHEFGFRIQKCLASQGWDVGLLSPHSMQSFSTSDLFDFALIDIALLNALTPTDDPVIEVLKRIRRSFRKVIVVEPDPWCTEHVPLLESIMEYVDFVWGFTADWPFLDQPRCKGKTIRFPNVGGFDGMVPERESLNDWKKCTFGFVGSIGIANLTRVYWTLESLHRKLPINYIITDPGQDDGKECEESLHSYARLLSASHVNINYVTRLDGSKMLTGRTLETISLKRLLLQETLPTMSSYFVEGEHFLDFYDIEGLSAAIEFIKMHPKSAQMIAREGYEYYLQHYSGRKLVEHFQVLLDS